MRFYCSFGLDPKTTRERISVCQEQGSQNSREYPFIPLEICFHCYKPSRHCLQRIISKGTANEFFVVGGSILAKIHTIRRPLKIEIGDLPIEQQQEENQIQAAVRAIAIQKPEPEELFHYNSLFKIERVLTIGQKWKQRANSTTKTSIRPDCQDLKSARCQLIRLTQEYYFPAEREALQKNKSLPAKSPIIHS